MTKETAFNRFMKNWQKDEFQLHLSEIVFGGIWHQGCARAGWGGDVRILAAKKWDNDYGDWRSLTWSKAPFIDVLNISPGDVISMPVYTEVYSRSHDRFYKEWDKFVFQIVEINSDRHVELLRLPGLKAAEVLYEILKGFSRVELLALKEIPDGLPMEMCLEVAKKIAGEQRRSAPLKLVV